MERTREERVSLMASDFLDPIDLWILLWLPSSHHRVLPIISFLEMGWWTPLTCGWDLILDSSWLWCTSLTSRGIHSYQHRWDEILFSLLRIGLCRQQTQFHHLLPWAGVPLVWVVCLEWAWLTPEAAQHLHTARSQANPVVFLDLKTEEIQPQRNITQHPRLWPFKHFWYLQAAVQRLYINLGEAEICTPVLLSPYLSCLQHPGLVSCFYFPLCWESSGSFHSSAGAEVGAHPRTRGLS